jgi:hypothetical protein
MTMTYEEVWADFIATKCSACGGYKVKMNAFCRRCYYRLPAPMRQALWQRFGEGFEEAFEAAKRWFAETAVTLS